MARNRGRSRGRGFGGGGGAARRGQGLYSERIPEGRAPGVIKGPQKEKPQQRGRRGGGTVRARQPQPTSSGRAGRGKASQSVKVVDVVPEDGFRRHQEIARAHGDAVMAIMMQEDAIYTASRDKLLKRWKACRNASGLFELQADLEVPLGEVCWCLTAAGEWLFCGLGTGRIRAYAKSGQDATLSVHSKRVSCMLTHQHVLISGSADATVLCWQMDPGSQVFNCTNKISEGIPGAVQSMSVLSDCLWVGGTSGVAVVELASLRVVKHLPPKKFVTGFLQYEGHMIVVYADGSVCIFDAAGNQKLSQPPMPAGAALCIAGLDSGPRVLCGHSKGQVSSITLPEFKLKHHWQAVEKCKVQTLCSAGHDGIFILGTENGSLQLWQRENIATFDI